MKKGNHIIIINGPTGVGKTTVIHKLIEQLPQLKTGVTYTTRAVRPADKEDKDMRHISREQFERMIDENAFLEWAEFSGNYYATARKENLEILDQHPLLLNIEVVGSLKVKEQYPDALLIYILPESIEQLTPRLEARGFSNTEKEKRIESAQWSIQQADKYDHRVINKEGEADGTVAQIRDIILHECPELITKKP